jgi:hypothetical protein
MNDEQTAAMMKLYRESLTGGSMAFMMLIMQLIGTGFFSLILANIIKSKPLLQINNLNQ